MSGITPLIDTLMHQVLGRQGEVSLQRALSEPVKAIPPGEGPRALPGDSSLDGRAVSGTLNDLRRLPELPNGERLLARGESSGAPPGSTQTHFSPAARTIADVLLRFPAPAPVIRPAAPLLTAQEPPAVGVVAERLEASVRDSGLFYEAHLKRWFQGDVPRQQLLREPQMQPGPRSVVPPTMLLPPNVSSPSGMPLVGATAELPSSRLILPGSTLLYMYNGAVTTSSGMPNAVSAAPAQMNNVSTVPEGGAGLASRDALAFTDEVDNLKIRGHREIVHESLQGLVRQQLDMLVTPTLRWEGDVWAGIFMALVIQLPARDKTQEDQRESSDSDDGWRSEMRLEVPNVGAFSVSLWFYRAVLSIDLTAADSATHQYLEKGIPALEQRLTALDLERVQVRARYIPQERNNDLAG
ncbi:flagellar hook-length control protein FliK [Vreelandella populi]|uniref:Flagellar hook-length control protein FliK n=1 Tax=Vreelandella populi TaxID=2498858 RepID=A0A433L9P8_9GAMM|nr:flagellar hook-length control protein FliK [Halomonas populi]RUR41382.1 flagellar hook-length control protein FliK [Halomonas populi]RUR44214.1 flagellar hook-length control protein FliK [Halomonas populi]RUR56206.1 flagellar hook-length control protein FliK [Halomonas populi]